MRIRTVRFIQLLSQKIKGDQMKIAIKLFLVSLIFTSSSFAQIEGLKGWNIYLDPGHSENENMGIYNYSEAKKVLRVGLYLRDLLLKNTDIDTVYLSRTNDQVQVSLSQRSDDANAKGAAWFHSIHSNAGAPTSKSTLLLWGQYYDKREKIPNGGKRMSDIMTPLLTQAMRTTTQGSRGDCSFYGTCSEGGGPYLSVNRRTTMPSELSEAGYHTNPEQNQLFMNAEQKLLQAYAIYWTILDYHNIQRPPVNTCVGIVRDAESGIPVNGAAVTIEGFTYTTDTYETVFKNYTSDPNQLHNGFYYIDSLSSDSVTISVTAPNYAGYSTRVAVNDTFFTFQDIELISTENPRIITLSTSEIDSVYPGTDKITVVFSRPMNTASVESSISLAPVDTLSYSWSKDARTLTINTGVLSYNTEYTLTMSAAAEDKYEHSIDGNGDGTGGDSFVFNFRTRYQDRFAPVIYKIYPADNQADVELQPVISITLDERANTSTLGGKFKIIRDADQSTVSGVLKHYIIKDKSVMILFPGSLLKPQESYSIRIEPGVGDPYGNVTETVQDYKFTTGNKAFAVTKIDELEGTFMTNWWQPQQSGSTRGLLTFETSAAENAEVLNSLTKSTKSMQLNYGWDLSATGWLIRQYLGGGTPKNVKFDNNYLLQAYIFGDGNGNNARFAVHDNTDIEVSPWYTVDWYGWKLVSWDMKNDGTGSWIGDGNLSGALYFDSFQFTYNPGSENTGVYYLDDLRVVKTSIVSDVKSDDSEIPTEFVLNQNYPNPFNPSTVIKYSLPASGFVTLSVYDILGKQIAVLVNEYQSAGTFSYTFDASQFASGMYIYKIQAGDKSQTHKMMLIK